MSINCAHVQLCDDCQHTTVVYVHTHLYTGAQKDRQVRDRQVERYLTLRTDRCRISHANICGLSALHRRTRLTTSIVVTLGLLPPMCPGSIEPVLRNLRDNIASHTCKSTTQWHSRRTADDLQQQSYHRQQYKNRQRLKDKFEICHTW